MATGNQTLSGTSGDDVLLGAAGIDTATTNTGTDIVLTYGGDDTITIDGSGNKTIDGGSGTDSLNITSISNLSSTTDLLLAKDGSYFNLTFIDGSVVSTSNLEDLKVSGVDYGVYGYNAYEIGGGITGGVRGVFLDTATGVAYLARSEVSGSTYGGRMLHNTVDGVTVTSVIGTSLADEFGNNGQTWGDVVVNLGDGNDFSYKTAFANTSDISFGAGDDIAQIKMSASDLSALNTVKFDGGAGSDTLYFEESTLTSGYTLDLTEGGATNFENITGSDADEIINGDANANILKGGKGFDKLYGFGGNDTLYSQSTAYASGITDNSELYGGTGNDTLYGSDGDDQIDGGAGTDTLVGGDGIDTFVIRAGDGGATVSDADVITDFTNGSDVFGLDDGLQYSDLTIEQGSGDYANDTVIKYGAEYLAIVKGVSVGVFAEVDFEPVNISQ